MSYAVNMVRGTAKEIAAVGLARMLNRGRGDAARIIIAERDLARAERREHVKAGRLPRSTNFAHPVPLRVDLVYSVAPEYFLHASLADSVEAALTATVEGAYQLRFDETGEAFLSFELESDAVLFRLALA